MEFNYFSLQRGRRLIYSSNTLYANVFYNLLHRVDLFTQHVTSTKLEDNYRVLTAVTYLPIKSNLEDPISQVGFLVYDMNKSLLEIHPTSELKS